MKPQSMFLSYGCDHQVSCPYRAQYRAVLYNKTPLCINAKLKWCQLSSSNFKISCNSNKGEIQEGLLGKSFSLQYSGSYI